MPELRAGESWYELCTEEGTFEPGLPTAFKGWCIHEGVADGVSNTSERPVSLP